MASNITVATLPRLTATQLSKLLLDSSQANTVAVIDVRDNDHIGGNIKGSLWEPVANLDWKTPELVRTLADKRVVVFHCMLSQQRGPFAALRYARERMRLLGEENGKVVLVGSSDEQEEGAQKVAILDRGFEGWQQEYGEDERLTASFDKELWRGED